MDSQQTQSGKLLTPQFRQQQIDSRMQLRRLIAAFLAIPRHLPARPEPRHLFDNVARASNPLPPKGFDLLAVYRSVMAAAIATKDTEIIERTQFEIIAYHDELLAQALADSPLLAKVAFKDIACDAIEETAEATAALGVAGTLQTPAAIDRAVGEAGQAIVKLELFCSTAANRVPNRRISLHR